MFTDGSRISLINNESFNCDGSYSAILGTGYGKYNELEQLKTKKIQTLRVYTINNQLEQNFSEENQIEFNSVINCLNPNK